MQIIRTTCVILTASLLVFGCGGGRDTIDVIPVSNTAPTLGAVEDQNTDANVSSDAISVTIADAQTLSDALTVVATSDNQNIVADSGIVVSGSGGTRSVVIQPVTDQIGSTVITLTVTDAGGLSGTTSFGFSVNALNLSFQQFVRSTFADNANAEPRSVNIVNFAQDAEDDDFADLLTQ